MRIAAWHWVLAALFALAGHAAIGLVLLTHPGEPLAGGSMATSVGLALAPAQVTGSVDAGRPEVSAQRAGTATATASTSPPQQQVPAEPVTAQEPETPDAAAPTPTELAGLAVPRPGQVQPPQTLPPRLPPSRLARSHEEPEPEQDRAHQNKPTPKVLSAAADSETESAMQAAANPEPPPDSGPDSASPGQSLAAGVSTGPGSTHAKAAYVSLLQQWLERHKLYPQRAMARRQQGTATLYFVVDRAGRVLEHRLEQSSGHRLLDREALAMIDRAAPLPRMPAAMSGDDLAVIVPIQFALR